MTTLILLAHVSVVPHVHAEGVVFTALAVLGLGVALKRAARDRSGPTTKDEAS